MAGYRKISKGMFLALTLIGLAVLANGLTVSSRIVFGPFLLSKSMSMGLKVALVIVLCICFQGILRRRLWSQRLTVFCAGLVMAFTLTNFFVSYFHQSELYRIYPPSAVLFGDNVSELSLMTTVLVTTIAVFLYYTIIAWQVYWSKDYFTVGPLTAISEKSNDTGFSRIRPSSDTEVSTAKTVAQTATTS